MKAGGKSGCKVSSGEFLSGFYKDDKLLPVITLVIHFGPEEWDAPMGLHDMIKIEDPELLSYIPDYRINLISPYSISDISLDQFHTSLREVILFIKYSKDKNRLRKIVTADPHFLSVDRKAGQVIKILTGSDFEIREEEEKIDMCKALEDLKEEGRQEGWQEGRQDGIRKLILKILAKNQFSYEEIADMTEMSVEEIMEIDRSAAGQQ
ncbi:Rpn family recombination-promoting nuclease/putative transposase [Blautia caecimuris]|nr:Rpn family recombination-promoting nuclease/putative transposase [Blautia caecimuris]MCR2002011.1 Rpn family recombination-promoting nuclease/putative transposase [Blautia caecimuris]